MRIMILDTYYPPVLQHVYASCPGLAGQPYAEQLRKIFDLGFGRADFLSRNLRRLGHEAEEVIPNAAELQRQWARERGLRLPRVQPEARSRRLPARLFRALRRRLTCRWALSNERWDALVVAAQVEAFAPDIIVNSAMCFPPEVLWHLKGNRRKLVGECGYPVPPGMDLRAYDLIVSCVPHFVDGFRRAGVPAALLPHGFESSVLDKLDRTSSGSSDLVFIGSLTKDHGRRLQVLETLSQHVPLRCWANDGDCVAAGSRLKGLLQPPVWGYDMYRKLSSARATLNIHIDAAKDDAGNMRLFEATGVGTLLVTDWKSNLSELFEPGKEVIAYRSTEECIELIRHYLEHPSERDAIARAGQQRTLREHTIYHRMQQLVDLVRAQRRGRIGKVGLMPATCGKTGRSLG